MLDNERIEDDYPWTIYLLVDLKVVFIITHIYVSVISLISTTTNTEATDDRQSDRLFTVTSSHSDVSVSAIDNAILWNCREFSMTKRYYMLLYWMALIALSVALISFCVIKVLTLVKVGWCGSDKRTLNKLWHMAVFQYLREKSEGIKDKQLSEKILLSLDKTIQLLNKDVTSENLTSCTCNKVLKTAIPCFLVIILALGMMFSCLSYNLHPLTCITKPGNDVISYKNERVEIRFPESILTFQKVALCIVLCLLVLFVGLATRFYYLTKTMVNNLLEDKRDYIKSEIDMQPVLKEKNTDQHDPVTVYNHSIL